MPIDRLDFDNLGGSDLVELVDAQVPEGLRIEYKRDMYGDSDAHKTDVPAMFNAYEPISI